MEKRLKVIYVSAEVAPFAKSGELADVASSLPKYLSLFGMDVSIFMPKYRRPEIESISKELTSSNLMVPLGDRQLKGRIFKSEQGKYEIYFVDNPKYFWRDNIYGTGRGEYIDNDERFMFFNRAVLEFLVNKKQDVDIIHCNNWPTAMIPVFLKTLYSKHSIFRQTATLLTLHNITYQGEFPPDSMKLTGLSWKYFNPEQLSQNNKLNFLKAGVIFSDAINTVSATYRREVLKKKYGFGLHDILQARRKSFFSIRNGIDYDIWNPETDPHIIKNYNPKDLKGKRDCKLDLIEEFGLKKSVDRPIIGVVSYLSSFKGFDILSEAIDELMKLNISMVINGVGEDQYKIFFQEAQNKYPGRLAFKPELNIVYSHKVAAGADIMLVPSLYEPCGLNQLYGFRYGTVPVVRSTGGLKEMVKAYHHEKGDGNGFVFKEYSPTALAKIIEEAVSFYKKPLIWRKIIANGFNQDCSWKKAARKYERLYNKIINLKRGGQIV